MKRDAYFKLLHIIVGLHRKGSNCTIGQIRRIVERLENPSGKEHVKWDFAPYMDILPVS